MIKIEGLTPRQYEVCEQLWTCSDLEDVMLLIEQLPTHKDRVDAASLVRIMTWMTYEQELGLGEYEDDAQTAIDRARGH